MTLECIPITNTSTTMECGFDAVNSKSFVGKAFLLINRKFELRVYFKQEIIRKRFSSAMLSFEVGEATN